ncbi:MAG TPA: hypothetical protein VNL18_08380 [Gemmatimonadales bacterium]|nr:hypothetical protein [Gemmatimonadales bacterium]
MDIKPDRMVHLGYGKYWRSDAIVGLMPIESERGPGRRTEVYTATLSHPIVASRSEQAILEDMALASGEQFQIAEARAVLADLVDAFNDIPDVLRRLLANEARLDVDAWIRRIRETMKTTVPESADQSELFT